MSVTPKSEEAPLSFQGLVRLAVNHIYSFCEWNHFKYDHVIVVFAYFMIGIIWGSLSPVLQKHRNPNDELYFSDEDCTWMVTSQNLGYFVGCSLLTLVADKVGRNTVIISSTLLVLVSCSVALIKKVILLQLSRFLAGMTVGINAIIIPIYIGENSSPNVRGVFNSVTNLFIDVGMIFSSSVTTYCSYEISAVIFVAASLVNLLSEMLLREPAQHLLAKGRQTKAENQFFWLRGRNEVSQKEFDDITMSLNKEKAKFSWTFVFDRNFQITAVMSTFMVLTGYFPVVSLVSIILVPTKKLATNELAILFNMFQLSGSVISPFIIDRFRRRTLWIFSAILVTVSHIFTAALYICREKGFEVWNAEWLLFGSVTAYATIFAALMYPLVPEQKRAASRFIHSRAVSQICSFQKPGLQNQTTLEQTISNLAPTASA
ncbi:hypothetical protein V9T40_010779 [Parthenolecanium corni]|uniref:Major facilitator superfamily (MFS) profile domain-containing protein n=1 Tax=Parthenolecanium corni TaxID=536013 RepID=A0AAN9T816_9HEMI